MFRLFAGATWSVAAGTLVALLLCLAQHDLLGHSSIGGGTSQQANERWPRRHATFFANEKWPRQIAARVAGPGRL